MKPIPLSSPDITDAEREAVLAVLHTSQLSLGPAVRDFEQQLASYCNKRNAVAVNSGTSALHLCVKGLGIGAGDEVITTPFSFVASANCLLYEGAVPVFVDIDPATLNLDTTQVGQRVTPRTKAILPVHVFGLPCNMDAICQIATSYGLDVIEDACEAIGATYRDRLAGTFGRCGVFAFYPNKQMTTGEGGAIVTDDDELAAVCRSMRNQGRAEGGAWLAHERLGYNYRLSDLHSALGSAQLNRLPELLAKRANVARNYRRMLADVDGILLPAEIPTAVRSWFVYVVLLDESYHKDDRDAIVEGLRGRGIGSSNYFPPIHLQPFYASQFGFVRGDFPISESVSERTIALPFYGDLSEEDVLCVVGALKDELSKLHNRKCFAGVADLSAA